MVVLVDFFSIFPSSFAFTHFSLTTAHPSISSAASIIFSTSIFAYCNFQIIATVSGTQETGLFPHFYKPPVAQRAMSSVPSPHHPPSRPGFQPTSTSTLHPHPPAASSSTHMYQNHTLPGRNGIVTSQMRIDIHAIKQELHDVLGEAGLPYWKSLNAYLVGQLGRGELEEMVRGWLKGDHCASPISYSLLVIFRTDF